MSNQTTALIPAARIERRILLLRGQKVMLDRDLAELYGVETKALNQAVKRNLERFPADFMFQVSKEEAVQILRSQIVTLRHGEHLKYRPYAFTEQGIGMLSGVLNSPRAVQTHIAIIRVFVQLHQMLASHAGLAQKLKSLESKYDKQFRVVFDAIRELMSDKKVAKLPRREIGFHTAMPKAGKVNGATAKAGKS